MIEKITNIFHPKIEVICNRESCTNTILVTKGELLTRKIILCDKCTDHILKKLERRKK